MIKIYTTQHKLGIGSCFLQLLSIIGLIILLNQDMSTSLQAILNLTIIFTTGNLLISCLTILQNRFAKNAWEEINDITLTNKEKQIFSTETLEDNFHQASYRRFRRFFIPFAIIIISLIQFTFLFSVWQQKISTKLSLAETDPLLLTTSFCIVFATIFFLLSKYLGGLAYHNKHYFLRPIVSGLFSNSVILFFIAITSLTSHLSIFIFGKVIIYILTIIISIVMAERIILWLLDFYRPKIQTDDLPIYDSRFLSLFSHSSGILHSFSDIIQYQFGIKINEKVFVSFFKRYLIYAILIQLFLAFLLSTIVYITPQTKGIEQNIITYQTTLLEPGLYWRLPYPLVSITRLPNKKTQRLIVTHSKVNRPNKEDFIPWAKPRSHNSLQVGKDSYGNSILTSLEIEVFYSITNHQQFVSNNAQPHKTIDLITKQEINHYLTTHNFHQTLNNYTSLKNYLKQKLNQRFNKQYLGIRLEQLNITSFTPPAPIAAAYKQFLITEANVDITNETSKRDAFFIRNLAQRTAFNIINKAQNETNVDKILYAEERKYFTKKQDAFNQNPKLYKTIELMNLLEQTGKNPKVQKIIILSNKDKIINLDLKGLAPDFLITE